MEREKWLGSTKKENWGTSTTRPVMATPTIMPTQVVPPCALFDVNDHITNKFPTLPELQNLFHPPMAVSIESTPSVDVTLPYSLKDPLGKQDSKAGTSSR